MGVLHIARALKRFVPLRLGVIVGLASALAAPAGATVLDNADIEKTFFAGAFYDLPAGKDNQLTRYLVRPAAGVPAGAALQGHELSGVVAGMLGGQAKLVQALNLSLAPDGVVDDAASAGNPVAVYVSRAQHEILTYTAPGVPDEFLTVFSIAVNLDIFTDQAAMSSRKRLESVYSKLLVGERSVITDRPLAPERLGGIYRELFALTLAELAERVAEDMAWKRDRAEAVFQLARFALPEKNLPPEIAQLVDAAIGAEGRPFDAAGRAWERERLGLELLHTVNQFLSDELRRQGVSDVALMSPPTPWAHGNVGELLAGRIGGRLGGGQPLRLHVDSSIEDTGQLRIKGRKALTGYTVNAGLLKASTAVVGESSLGRASQFNTTLGARILRPVPGGKPKVMPATIEDNAKKTALGVGFKEFRDIKGMVRPTTREVALDAVRMAAREMAPKLVELMRAIAADPINNR